MTDRHYILLPESEWAGPVPFLMSGPDLDLHRGVPVSLPTEVLRYELRVDKQAKDPKDFPPLDLHDPGNGQLLMSEKLLKTFHDCGVDNLQLLSAEVRFAHSGLTLNYQIGNIIGLVKALDVGASECQVDEDGFVEGFSTLRLSEDRIAGQDLFRMYESFHTIIVSSRVKDALEAQSITGMQFLRDEDWLPGML